MPDKVSGAEMAKRNASTGTAFDKHFLAQMHLRHRHRRHRHGQDGVDRRQNSEPKALANSTIAGQSMEITEMKSLLTTINAFDAMEDGHTDPLSPP